MLVLRRSSVPHLFVVAALALGGCSGTQNKPGQESLDADPPAGSVDPEAAGKADADLARGIAFVKNEKYADAKPHLERAVEQHPKNAEAAYYLGVSRERTDDRAGAEAAYKKALAADPGFAEAAQNLAALYLDDPPRPDEAIAVLKTALEKTKGSPALLENLAYAYGLKGDVDAASRAYEEAIAKADSPRLRFAYGSMLVEAKQGDKAADHLRKALDGTKDDAPMLGTLGRLLAFSKAYGDCVKALDRAIKLKPAEPEWLVRRGTCKHELKDELGARADYEGAIKAKEDFAAAHYYLGLSLHGDKKLQTATQELEKAVKYGGDSAIGKAAKEKLDSIKGGGKKK